MALVTRTDVTVVKFYRNLILAGIGNTINVFNKSTTKLRHRLVALNGQKIYGFVPSKCRNKILVFGGKQFTVVVPTGTDDEGVENGVLNKEFEAVVCDDWLHSALWIDDKIVAVLTAHNVVQKWDITTQKQVSHHPSKDNSILYSGLLVPLQHDVLVMAGTVFSQVIIHRCGDEEPLHHLRGHKGVIFSITCKPENDIIVTTSDDRAVRIWGPKAIPTHAPYTIDYWQNIEIECKHELYGHLARVMRSCITDNLVVSVGEDSAICYWDYQGQLLKKAVTHQNSCIWSADSDGDHLITGGGDCGVIIHPLSVATDYSQNEVLNISVANPKKVEFTARKNLVTTDESNVIYYDFLRKNKFVYELNHSSTYRLISLSSCKQLIALADMTGKLDIFIEKCKGDAELSILITTHLNIGKVLSMHWAGNRHLVFCTDDGNIIVYGTNNTSVEKYANFILPPCKEALLTAVAIDNLKRYLAVGDRSGNVHIFVKGQSNPIKSFAKVHGIYGPRSIKFKGMDLITTGRDHSIKYFCANENNFKLMNTKKIPFAWVEKFLDKDLNIVCGFQERVFTVYNTIDNSIIVEIPCGGGHRSFDVVKYIDKINENYEEILKLVYLKEAEINVVTFQLSKIVSKNVINGSHAKEINCLSAFKVDDSTIYITGGEDTTLRISSISPAMDFKDNVCFRHLSSIRALKTYFIDNNSFFLISVGGRAQICIKKVTIKDKLEINCEEIIDYLLKGTDKERKGNKSWRNAEIDFDSEIRFMDVDVINNDANFTIFAGCSDGYIRIFNFKQVTKKLELINALKYHNTCLLKIKIINIFNKNILITGSTRGQVTLTDVVNTKKLQTNPFFTLTTNKSGINSLVSAIINENHILIGTAGDDNAIHLALLEIPDQNTLTSIKVLHTWNCANYHSSQITGLILVDNYLISASIDQRITLLKWEVRSEGITCMFVCQVYTNIADVQGMDLMVNDSQSITVCVYGKGMEVIAVPKMML